MATNPMQRKARNSFLLGMLLMLIICGLIIAFLFIQLKNYQDKEKAVVKVKIAVLKEDVKAGQIITSSMLTKKDIDKTLIPENAIGDEQTLKNYSLQDKQGNEVSSKVENGENVLYLTKNNTDYKLEKDDSGSYYIERNNNKEYIELKKQIHKLMDRNLNIQKLYDENIFENGLSSGECKDLSKILVLYDSLEDIVEKEIYFKGGMDLYYYFKRIGILD